MPEDKTLGLNNGEEKTPSGNGQPQNNASDSATNPEELETEVDKILGDKKDDDDDIEGLEDDDEDTVVLPKKQVKQILRDKKNYRDGLLSVKTKLKGFKKPATSQPEKKQQPASGGDDAPVTRGDLNKVNEKKAIAEACKDDTTDKNWDDIVKFYTPRRGKESPEAILADIEDAKTLWEKNSKSKSTENAEDKNAAADLASDKGKPAGKTGEGKPQERKSILTKKTPVQDWYK